jgi:multicomponent Na+:H+ antiporter subunit D
MIEVLPPGFVLILGGMLLPLLRGRAQAVAMAVLPVLSFAHMLALGQGTMYEIELFGYQLTLVRIDKLSLVFGYVFHIAAFLGGIYALHVRDGVQHTTATMYVGTAVAALFAGDLITLFIYWELTAVTSVFLIWAGRTAHAWGAGMRYLIIQVGSGVVLLAGVILHVSDTGSLAFDRLIGPDGLLSSASPGVLLIFLAFGIKCAFPLLHNWLQDSYPESTPTGTLYLSIFTTKMAVYALARGFPGTDMLIWIGAAMTAFPIFYAVIENDLRRVLTYSLNNQLGFMVVGVGIGTQTALNGTCAYAFANIIFEGLLFMAMGAVLLRTGTCNGSELGGLYKSMPLTAALCIVGAASISAFPFLSGFVTKALILDETAAGGHKIAFLMLLFASAGVFHHSGIKIPYFAFFAHDSGKRVKEAPGNMLIAMALMAAGCIGIGMFPQLFYRLLPYPVDYQPYTITHIITQYQILLYSALAFTFLQVTRIYPPELRSVNLDTDWLYRRVLPAAVGFVMRVGGRTLDGTRELTRSVLDGVYRQIYRLHGPEGVFARTWSTGLIAFWAVVFLWGFLLLYYWNR